MRVSIIITRGDTIGGAQTHVFLLAKNLQNAGHQVQVLVGGETGPFTKLLSENDIPFTNIVDFSNSASFLKDVRSFFMIRRCVKLFRPDLLSLHSTKAGLLGRMIGSSLKLPVVLTVHGWAFAKGVPVFKKALSSFIEWALSSYINKYILVSEYDLHLATAYNIASKSKFHVIHNGVEDTCSNNRYSIQDKDYLSIVMVARFDKQKNQKLLFDACKDQKEIELNFIGDGPLLSEMICYHEGVKPLCKVNFYGLRLDAKELMKKNHVFALISNWEGFPMSTLEAMCHGMPVLVSDVGGACECVEDSVNGFVIPRGDEICLKRRIKQFIYDRRLIADMGQKSREIYLQRFTVQKMYEMTENVFKSVIMERGK